MGVTGDRLRTMAEQIDRQQLDREATAAQLRQLAGDVDRVEDQGEPAQPGGQPGQAGNQTGQSADPNQQQGARGSW